MTDQYMDLAKSMARPIIEDVCPKELPLYADLCAEFESDPEGFCKPVHKSGSHLGSFGVADLAALTSVFILIICYEALKELLKDELKARVKRLLKSTPDEEPSPSSDARSALISGTVRKVVRRRSEIMKLRDHDLRRIEKAAEVVFESRWSEIVAEFDTNEE